MPAAAASRSLAPCAKLLDRACQGGVGAGRGPGEQRLLERRLDLAELVDRAVERAQLERGKLARERRGDGGGQEVAAGDADRPAREGLRAQRVREPLPEVVGAPDLVARDEILARAGRIADEHGRSVDGKHERGVPGAPQTGLRSCREERRMVARQPCARSRAVVERASERDDADEPATLGRLANARLSLEQLWSQGHRRSIAERLHYAHGTMLVRLAYRTPLARDALLGFLALRAIPGVEEVVDDVYRRVVSIDGRTGVLTARLPADRDEIDLEVDDALTDVIEPVVEGARRIFDVDADPLDRRDARRRPAPASARRGDPRAARARCDRRLRDRGARDRRPADLGRRRAHDHGAARADAR